ncbi:pentatricopeptide repeat-containing protein At3g24000, mitochondrial-like [Malania oleifera]|uniref:pentatricopeptide repeat-containing protein At3g24000, mitochondrial-like n=1 Tax=Malania oleifera TaxID=397392 RepID=UPI0025ADA91C|nr:pentatricopeptide repeat-containing protein At3g24000, mitochondrial-like [Malania oleifera]XP_057960744.1 pentatricopeptide repeat-containing protein At3g24000, mitochondrial-like [Malania oleifera]XP_057960746.1 pentatricopeptide repeat-containing protein At3g24000, mitochondrial-like [Malania oleifera]XP_057960747.1 pentatricopeptide repeat-containing protein At3g24000, mitochondrial-like [Malania oleifera]XP_057960748.1 pentatricopeptide repeat-containing protein At3g24000, mitochondrial
MDRLRMRTPPIGFRGFFLPHCSIPTFLIHFPDKRCTSPRQFLLYMQLNYSSCAALRAVESNPTSDVALNDVQNFSYQLAQECNRVPSNILKAGTKRRALRLDKRAKAKSENERLKWYSEMLHNCSLKGCLTEGKAVHGQIIKNEINPDLHLWVSLVNFYAKCGSCQAARHVFDAMPEHDVVSWTALIAGFVAEGHGSDGVRLFCEMRKEGIKPNEFTFASGLKACCMCLSLDFGKQVHAEVIKVGVFSDLFVGSALVDIYAKCGEMGLANRVFFCLPEKNAVSWNALLNGYAQIGDRKGVLNLFCRMTELGVKFSKFTLSTVLKGCANSKSLREGRIVHSLAIRIGCDLDEFLSCCIVDLYSKCGLADDAIKVFRRIKYPDIVTWSAMITCLHQHGRSEEALQLFHFMTREGLRPNQHTLASIVSAATDLGELCYGESIHACICKCGFESDNLVNNALITMYMKIGSVQDGCLVFEAMPDPDLVSWNALLSGFHDNKTCERGPRIFNQMLLEGLRPNMYTFISILRSCSSLLNVNFGKQVHAHIIKNNLDSNTFVGTALVDMYAKGWCLEDANLIFDRLNERDIFTWTVIIGCYAQIDQGEKAVKCFTQMQREGLNPNEFTLSSCLSGCSSLAALENGRQLHSLAIKAGHLGDLFVASALVDMYAKCGCIGDAEAVFEGSVPGDTVLWNTILCGFSQHGMGVKALEAFRIMLDEGVLPDKVTFIVVLSACSHMGLIEEGKKHFDAMNRIYGIAPTIEHYACMVDILGRAGKLDEVESFIKDMKLPPNALIWQTVLGACKLHGNVEFGQRVAHKLFELEPDMDSNYILMSNIFAAKGRWDDVTEVRALMSSRGVKKEPGCSWVEVNAQVHVFLSHDSSHPMIGKIYLKLEELGQKLISAGYIPNMEHALHNVPEPEKLENLMYHSERLALAFALINTSPRKTIRIFKNLRICGDCHDVMKLISDITNREIVVRDISRFHHFKKGICSCEDYW